MTGYGPGLPTGTAESLEPLCQFAINNQFRVAYTYDFLILAS